MGVVAAVVLVVCSVSASGRALPPPAAQNPNPTLVVKESQITFGNRALLEAGYAVDVSAPVVFMPSVSSFVLEEQAFGAESFAPSRAAQLPGVHESSLGKPSWAYRVAPAVTTSYRIRWEGFVSEVATVQVAPRLSLTQVSSSGDFLARASAGRPLAGRRVYVQRETAPNVWRTLKTLTLGPNSSRRFTLELSRRSALRLCMPAAQAGRGYAEGLSRRLLTGPTRTT